MVKDSGLPSPLICPVIGECQRWWSAWIENLLQPVLHLFPIEVIDIDLKSTIRCDMTFHFKTSLKTKQKKHELIGMRPFSFMAANLQRDKTQWRLPELLQKHNVTLFSHILPSERFCPLPPDIIGVTFEETNLLNYLCRLVSRTWVTSHSNYCSTSCQCSKFSWKRVE